MPNVSTTQMKRRMKALTNIRSLVLMTALFAIAPASAQQVADDEELTQVRQKVNAMFQAISPEDVTPSPLEGWYTIHRGSIVAYVSADARYLIQGDLIDLDSNVNLSEIRAQRARGAT